MEMTATTIDQVRELLGKTPPFSESSSDELDDLVSSLSIADYPPGVVVLKEGQTEHPYLYLLVSGEVRLTETTTSGETRTFGEGKLLGHFGLLRGGALPYQAETTNAARFALIPAATFHDLCRQHPRLLAYFESDIRVYTRHNLTLYDLSGAQFLFGTRLRDLINHAPPQCAPSATVRIAASIMSEQDCDYLVVMQGVEPIGLITDRQLRRKIVATGVSQETPVHAIMCTELICLMENSSLYEGLLKMIENGLSHILVRGSDSNRLLGVVSDKDIARSHGYNPMLLFRQVEQASTVEQLADLRVEANQLLLQLYKRGVRAQDLITINTMINDNLTGRVLTLSQSMAECAGDISLNWAWLSLGSEGRGEMGLKTDQDNALAYQVLSGDEKLAEQWLASWAERANQSLDQIDLSLCAGNMMAGNPVWRLPAQGGSAVSPMDGKCESKSDNASVSRLRFAYGTR